MCFVEGICVKTHANDHSDYDDKELKQKDSAEDVGKNDQTVPFLGVAKPIIEGKDDNADQKHT